MHSDEDRFTNIQMTRSQSRFHMLFATNKLGIADNFKLEVK